MLALLQVVAEVSGILDFAVRVIPGPAAVHFAVFHVKHPVAHLCQLFIVCYNKEALVEFFSEVKKELMQMVQKEQVVEVEEAVLSVML